MKKLCMLLLTVFLLAGCAPEAPTLPRVNISGTYLDSAITTFINPEDWLPFLETLSDRGGALGDPIIYRGDKHIDTVMYFPQNNSIEFRDLNRKFWDYFMDTGELKGPFS